MKRKPRFTIEASVARKHGEEKWRALVAYEVDGERTTLTSADTYDNEADAAKAAEQAFDEVERRLIADKKIKPSALHTLTIYKGGKA